MVLPYSAQTFFAYKSDAPNNTFRLVTYQPDGTFVKRDRIRSIGVLAALGALKRKDGFCLIDRDSLPKLMQEIEPSVAFTIESPLGTNGKLPVKLIFRCFEDFGPVGIIEQVEPLAKRYALRQDLTELGARLDGNPALYDFLTALLGQPELRKAVQGALWEALPPASAEPDVTYRAMDAGEDNDAIDLISPVHDGVPLVTDTPAMLMCKTRYAARLLEKDPRWVPFCTRLGTFFTALAQWCESPECPEDVKEAHATHDPEKVLGALIADLDRQLAGPVNVILHHPKFQRLEATWRGLHYLVDRTETSPQLRIEVWDVTKEELRKELEKAGMRFQRTRLYRELVPKRFTRPNGKPFSLLVADYDVDHLPPDVTFLKRLAPIVATAHVSILFGAAPKLLGLENFRQLEEPFDVAQRFAMQDYTAWHSLRKMPDSRYIGLVGPRFLLRLPYHPDNNPVEGFVFQEDIADTKARDYLWGNSVFALSACVTNALYWHGAAAAIRGAQGGGLVVDLPLPPGSGISCPIETFIDGELLSALTNAGLIMLSPFEDADYAVFFNVPSLRHPETYTTPGATASDFLSSQLSYLMAVGEVIHCLNTMLREWTGLGIEREEIERRLQIWLFEFTNDNLHASQEQKSRYPFKNARVDVREVPGKPGTYEAIVFLRPHVQFEGVAVTVHLVSEIPQTV